MKVRKKVDDRACTLHRYFLVFSVEITLIPYVLLSNLNTNFRTFCLRDKFVLKVTFSRCLCWKHETFSFSKHQKSSKTVHGVRRTTSSKLAMWVWNLLNQRNAVCRPMCTVHSLHWSTCRISLVQQVPDPHRQL